MKWGLLHGAILSAIALTVVSCASSPEPQPQPAPARPQPQAPAVRPTPKPVAPPTYKPMADDQCGASQLQHLVGKPRTEIPVPLDPGTRRVVCSSCIVTQEYRADRQTIIFSSETGIIQSVKCG